MTPSAGVAGVLRGFGRVLVPPVAGRAASLDPVVLRWLVAAMACATIPYAGTVPPWIIAVAVVLGAWRLHPVSSRHLLPRGARLAVIPLLIALLIVTSSIGFGVEAAAPFFVGFLWLKLIELEQPRDVLVSCTFGVFLIASHLLAEQSLMATAWGVCCLAMFFAVAVRLHAPRGILSTLGTSLSLLAVSVPMAVALFIVAPRPQLHLAYPMPQAARAGVSDVLRPGDIASVALDSTPMFTAESPEGLPADLDRLYWRVAVLWFTPDGSRWLRGGVRPDVVPMWPVPSETPSWPVEILLQHGSSRLIPVPDRPLTVPDGMRLREGAVVELERASGSAVAYRISGDGAAMLREDQPSQLEAGLQLPQRTASDRLLALAESWRKAGGAATAADGWGVQPELGAARAAVVAAGLRHLATGGYRYTLDPGRMGDELADTLLFDRKAGFCGHYSAAFSLVLRHAGVPTRIIIGYRGAELNAVGGHLVVRGFHAHAWVETWISPDEGWRRIDPTAVIAGGTDQERQAAGTAAVDAPIQRPGPMRIWREWMETKWYRFVLSFDADEQAGLMRWLGLEGLGGLAPVVLSIIAIALAFAAALYVAMRQRGPVDALGRALAALDGSAAACQLGRAPHEGPRTWFARIALARPDLGWLATSTGEHVAAIRYDPTVTPELQTSLRRQVIANCAVLAKELRRRRP